MRDALAKHLRQHAWKLRQHFKVCDYRKLPAGQLRFINPVTNEWDISGQSRGGIHPGVADYYARQSWPAIFTINWCPSPCGFSLFT